MTRSLRALVVLLVTGCGGDAVPESASVPAGVVAAPPLERIAGEWYVTAVEQPGISALSEPDARARVGWRVAFSDSAASFGDELCAAPIYRGELLTSETFLETYRVEPGSLGLADSVAVTRVECAGGRVWPGSTLIHRERELLALLDGTFFVLGRPN